MFLRPRHAGTHILEARGSVLLGIFCFHERLLDRHTLIPPLAERECLGEGLCSAQEGREAAQWWSAEWQREKGTVEHCSQSVRAGSDENVSRQSDSMGSWCTCRFLYHINIDRGGWGVGSRSSVEGCGCGIVIAELNRVVAAPKREEAIDYCTVYC